MDPVVCVCTDFQRERRHVVSRPSVGATAAVARRGSGLHEETVGGLLP